MSNFLNNNSLKAEIEIDTLLRQTDQIQKYELNNNEENQDINLNLPKKDEESISIKYEPCFFDKSISDSSSPI